MLDFFLLIGLPYIALFSIIIVTIYRYRTNKYGISSFSSQFLEKEKLLWGSVPWHIGIGIIILGHFLALFTPKLLQSLVSNIIILYTFESIGLIAALFAFAGLAILFVRRLLNSQVQAVTSTMDLIILTLLTIQVLLGILTATLYRWGASWSPQTMAPYVWSILSFHPDTSYIQGMPHIIKTHIILAWIIILLVPFTRLVHFFFFPFEYIYRLPQVVVWNCRKQEKTVVSADIKQKTRRYFLKAAGGIIVGAILLLIGTIDIVIPFFRGPSLTKKEKAKLLKEQLERIQALIKQKQLEHERLLNDFIFVANLKDLRQDEGIYFIDYDMKTGLAFLGSDGMPVLYSAKCTHLGCTIINKVTDGKLLCPCHMSHFEIESGKPLDGPATTPLARIKYILKDKNSQIVKNIDDSKLKEYKVYISRGERA